MLHRELARQRVDAQMAEVPDAIKSSAPRAWRWAQDRLMRREGEGHCLHIHREKDGGITCSFAKPEWPGDHCGSRMPTGALAIVRSVLEYENGL